MTRQVVGVIDAGIGNIAAVVRVLAECGADTMVVADPEDVLKCAGVVLPGVGSFDSGVHCLKTRGFWELLQDKAVMENHYILGICLGMQLFASRSEEGCEAGLGIIPGIVRHLSQATDLPNELTIPHIGWSTVSSNTEEGANFLKSSGELQRYYFVHSYFFDVKDEKHRLLSVTGAPNISAAVRFDKACGFQFHPEKSHRFGVNALRWWLKSFLC